MNPRGVKNNFARKGAGKMRFVRKYNLYGIEYYEVIYKSGRIVTYSRERLPKTIKAFLAGKEGREQFDKVFNRTETIYE